MKALITGITGSGASYLAEYLIGNVPNIEVHGISRWHSTASNKNLESIKNLVKMHECDLMDMSAVIRTLKEVKPDYIFHLASHANVKVCFSNPLAVFNNNISCTLNLFEAIRLLELDPIVQLCGTSEVYGEVDPKDVPIIEEHPLNPVNIYAVSKLSQEKIAMSYFHCYGARVIITRMFTYVNPRRGDIFSSAFAKQIVNIERGIQNKLYHGNLNSVRTLIDVRDAMESYWIASNYCEYGVPYNIGGHNTMTVGEFIDKLKEKSKVPIETELDNNLVRPKDVTLQIPNSTKFYKKTGWQPKYSMDQSIDFLLDFYRGQNV